MQLTQKFDINFSDLGLGVENIERILGKDESDNHVLVREMIESELNLARTIADIKAEYRVFDDVTFSRDDWSMTVSGKKFVIGKIISGQIRKATSVAVFVCTAGEELSELSSELIRKGDYLRGYILDIAGSEIVEAAADFMQDNLLSGMKEKGLGISNRYSPGYCGWALPEQHQLFGLIPSNYCRITLNDSALMTPRKSVSGIIGIGSGIKMLPYTCSLCTDTNCIYRRK